MYANDDTTRGGGVDEFTFFEVDADVRDAPCLSGVEENKVALLEAFAADGRAVALIHAGAASLKFEVEDGVIDFHDHAGAVGSCAVVTAISIRCAKPGFEFGIELAVVTFDEWHVEVRPLLGDETIAGGGEFFVTLEILASTALVVGSVRVGFVSIARGMTRR